jgi:hypothetical protein
MAPLVGASHKEADLVPVGATVTVPGVIFVASFFALLSRISLIGGAIVVLIAAGNPEVSTDPGGTGDAPRTLEVCRRREVGRRHRCQQQTGDQRNRSPPGHRDTGSSSRSPSGWNSRGRAIQDSSITPVPIETSPGASRPPGVWFAVTCRPRLW